MKRKSSVLNKTNSALNKTTSGFTLINLLVTLTISSMLISTGVPALSGLANNVQADNNYQRLFTLIQFARIQAVNYTSQVLICPTMDDKSCVNDWNQKLMVFVDSNDDESKNHNERILQISAKLLDKETISWKASGSKRYLRFKADGSTGNQNGRLTYCLNAGEKNYAKQIIVYRTGRIRKGDITIESC